MKVSVIGLGKLGAPLAAVMAHKGHEVIGLDVNQDFVTAINEGREPVPEPGLQDLITANRDRLRATTDYTEAVGASDATFIIVPTPSDADGTFSMRYALDASRSIGEALRNKDGYHLIVMTSTVMPGDTDKHLRPAIEKASGKKCGKDFGLCYNPEFIALGSVVRDMLNPDFLLIGESDEKAGDMLEGIYDGLCESNPSMQRMSFVNAELTKLAVNTFVTTKISYANMLARVCERLPGADADVVTRALGCDTRIGAKYLRGALGYGGPCFPRDNIAFNRLAESLEVRAILAEATDRFNRLQAELLAERVLDLLGERRTVAVLGLSYKPDTNVIEESQAINLCQVLADKNIEVFAHDPAAMPNAKRVLGDTVTFTQSARECANRADLLVITTAWKEYAELRPEDLNTGGRDRPTIVDCWRVLPRETFEPVADYVVMGLGPSL